VRPLGRYTTPDTGQRRVILAQRRADGGMLVIDCIEDTLTDQRLVAYLPADEPPENARLMCEMYLADPARGRCRPVTAEDLDDPQPRDTASAPAWPQDSSLSDPAGHIYRLGEQESEHGLWELRWTRSVQPSREERFEAVALRHVVARLKDYEPARSMTAAGLIEFAGSGVSVCRLTGELDRLLASPIVLNRALREAVQTRVARGEMTMSEIAMRCGRVKRDRRGRLSGETSWLARRIGQAPEGGEKYPTPWVHSDVLAKIAREGLGISPHEVEL